MYKYIIIMVLITGCFPPQECEQDDQIISGICFNKSFNVSEQDVNMIITTLEKEVQVHYPNVINIRKSFIDNKIRVTFIDASLYITCSIIDYSLSTCEKQVGGVNYNGHTIYLMWDSCVSHTALAHELMHSIQRQYDIPFDSNNVHKSTPWFFTSAYTTLDGYAIEDKYKTIEFNIYAKTYSKCESQGQSIEVVIPELTTAINKNY